MMRPYISVKNHPIYARCNGHNQPSFRWLRNSARPTVTLRVRS